jgi:hypothetical protein
MGVLKRLWEESKKEDERQDLANRVASSLKEKDFCSNFGKRTEIICQKKSLFDYCEKPLCHKCAKKCPICKKYFCKKHINNHSCKI